MNAENHSLIQQDDARKTKILVNFCILSGLEAFLCGVWLVAQPADPKNALLFGLSATRLIIFVFFISYGLAAAGLVQYLRKTRPGVMLLRRLFFSWILSAIFFLISLAVGVASMHVLYSPPPAINIYQYERLQPVLLWLALAGIEAAILFFFWCWQEVTSSLAALHNRYRHAKFQQFIPSLSNMPLNLLVMAVSLVYLLVQIPALFTAVAQADEKYHGTIPTTGDDCGYQALAVNLMNGYGYADWVCQPLEQYRFDLTSEPGVQILQEYEESGVPAPYSTYYRAPGLPLQLSAVYAVFGSQTIVARRMMALMLWLGLVFLLFTGWLLAGWVGALAGGLVVQYTLHHSPMILGFERILTEIPTFFWVSLFVMLFVLYKKHEKCDALALSALALGMAYLTRSNFITVLPLLVFYLVFEKRRLSHIAIFIVAGLLPLLAWASYASSSAGRLVIMPTQGESDFPSFNNIDVLEGIGEDRLLQGEWNPGFVLNDEGELELPSPYRNTPKSGENGYIKGLTFWKDNLTQLPRLFYVKMWKNFWYDGYDRGYARHYPVGINLAAIGFLLAATGLRDSSLRWRFQERLRPAASILLQLLLIGTIVLCWNTLPFWAILLLWLAILLVAVLFPYGTCVVSGVQSPVWILSLVISHLATTLLYGGARFHYPLDPLLTLLGVTGILLTIYYAMKRDLVVAAAAILASVIKLT